MLVQAGLSIVWTLIALPLMILGHLRGRRELWLLGAVPIAVVVAKLFFVELGNRSGLNASFPCRRRRIAAGGGLLRPTAAAQSRAWRRTHEQSPLPALMTLLMAPLGADYATQVPLTLEGEGPWYRLELPLSLQMAARHTESA